MMQIWPAIDLHRGRCVRLQQGDYDRETVFGEDPAAMARHWVERGAECLHLVDLDGARDGADDEGRSANWESIAAIAESVDIPCELGGGIRSEAGIAALLDLGLRRLVIGTLAIKQPDWFRRMCRRFPDKLVLGIDARDGLVATDGWLETSNLAATDLAKQFCNEPICAIVYTDIATDGMLSGPNVEAMREMRDAVDLPIVASGGVSSAEDVARLAAIPMAGCIVGRAIYEGKLSIAEATAAVRGEH